MRRYNNKHSIDQSNTSDPGEDPFSRYQHTKCGPNPMKLMGIFIVCLMGLSVLFSVSVILRDSSPKSIWPVADARFLDVEHPNEDDSSESVEERKDKLLGGLLSAGFDERSCLSRYQSVYYRKESSYRPSSYLLSRLRRYESLHKRCGPHTEPYNKALQNLQSGQSIEPSDCNYLVWISFSGLGNRILTLASAYLYALLTNRVLLVDRGTDMDDLFCEPFPETSWLLPLDFPITKQFDNLNPKSTECYGNILKGNSSRSDIPPFFYLHLVHDYDDHDKLFFCDQEQTYLQKVPWLIMKTDNYFIPSLFLMPSFEEELNNLFPEKGTVFHFLGRYLFFPTNPVWGLITRYYQAYLAKADERIGIQVRVFDTGIGPFQYVLDQILDCSLKESLLPEINRDEPIVSNPRNQKTKAVLMTSLSSGYSDKLKDMYWEHSTASGEVIGVFQVTRNINKQRRRPITGKHGQRCIY